MNIVTKQPVPADEAVGIIQSMLDRIDPKATILDKVLADDLESGWAAIDTTHGVQNNWFTLVDGREVVGVIAFKY